MSSPSSEREARTTSGGNGRGSQVNDNPNSRSRIDNSTSSVPGGNDTPLRGLGRSVINLTGSPFVNGRNALEEEMEDAQELTPLQERRTGCARDRLTSNGISSRGAQDGGHGNPSVAAGGTYADFTGSDVGDAAVAPTPGENAGQQQAGRSPLSRRRRPAHQNTERSSLGATDILESVNLAHRLSDSATAAGRTATAAAEIGPPTSSAAGAARSETAGSLGGSAGAAASLGATAAAADGGWESGTSISEYGGTPSALRRVRYARADLGDMGREFLLRDGDMQRLPELPREVVDSQMERKFEDFFDQFRIEDFQGLTDMTDEDLAVCNISANNLLFFGADSSASAISGGTAAAAGGSYYSLKLLQFMSRRGAAVSAGVAAASSGGSGSSRAAASTLSFDVSLQHLYVYSRELYTAAVNAPQDAIAAFDAILRRKYGDMRDLHGCFHTDFSQADPEELLLQQGPRLRLFGKPAGLMDTMRSLDPSTDIDRLVCFKGVVVRVSEVLPEMTMAAFRCRGQKKGTLSNQEGETCLSESYASVINGEVLEPKNCQLCGAAGAFELWPSQCAFASKQLVKLIELPELLLPGETPQGVSLFLFDEMVDFCRPGDRIEVTGIYKAAAIRVNPRLRLQNAVFRTYVNVIHIRFDENRQQREHLANYFLSNRNMPVAESAAATEENAAAVAAAGVAAAQEVAGAAAATAAAAAAGGAMQGSGDEEREFHCSAEMEARIKAISQRPDIYDLLVRSFAPSLFGREEVKKGVLCQLVGGTRLPVDSNNSSTSAAKNVRSELHVLLCGDPATAKSQLLQYVYKLSPRCMYTSGRGSSAVGLTVSVGKDPETKEFILESGAVVLADGGVCCIDEFDKMEESARAVLHEVMEQQTVTVAKAGIVASLQARTSILASANPVGSRYDRNRAVIENINLPPSLFSRFDLIYLLLDTADSQSDKLLAERLCRSFAGHSKLRKPQHGPVPTRLQGAPAENEKKQEDEFTMKEEEPPLPAAFLGMYLAYCRSHCFPRLSKEAALHLKDEYLRMRQRDAASRHPTATVRQLESLVRIAQALAKLRLAETVTSADAIEAIRLMNLATYQSLVDPLSGRIDFDQIHFGQTRQQRQLVQRVTEAVKEIFYAAAAAAGRTTGLSREQIFTKVKESMRRTGGAYEVIEPNIVYEALSRLDKDQIISKKAGGLYYMSAVPAAAEEL